MSQDKLAEYLGITKGTICNWENGKTQPTIEQIMQLSNIFCVSIDYLLGITDEDVPKIEKINQALHEAGLLNEKQDNITEVDLKKALKIIEIMKNNK